MIEKIKQIYDDRDNLAETAKTPSVCVYGWHEVKKIPKYTIAIPTYQRTNLLNYALRSCLDQENFDNFEILVVDNNPERNDATEMFMLSFQDNPKIAYYKNTENLGMTGNWNKLYLLARTEWVVMLHDDDMLYPDFMSVMAKVIDQDKEADCIYSCYNSIRNESDVRPDRQKVDIKVITLKETDYLTGCHIHAPLGMTLKRNVVFELGGFNPDYYPSLDFHFHAKMAHCYNVRWERGYPIATYRWLVNASCKEETLYGWINKDNKIKQLILRNHPYIVPGKLFDVYLIYSNYLFKKNWYGHNEKIKKPNVLIYCVFLLLKIRLGLPKKVRKIYTLKNNSLIKLQYQ